jgi:dihydroxyacid dehydratase/phosphogluconate dehydratase
MRCSPSMEAKTNLESRMPSRHVTEGPACAPHRHDGMRYDGMRSSLPSRDVIADSVSRKALENAAAAVAASGSSTNVALRQSAVAHKCRVAFDLDGAEVFKRTPYIADLKPAGRFVAKDLFEAGCVSLLMKTLLDSGFMRGDGMTVTGYGMAENLKRLAWNSDQIGMDNGPKATVGGPIGLARGGDIIAVDANRGSLEVQLSDVEFEKRRAAWQPRGSAIGSGYLWKYAQQVGSARHGAITHLGGAA